VAGVAPLQAEIGVERLARRRIRHGERDVLQGTYRHCVTPRRFLAPPQMSGVFGLSPSTMRPYISWFMGRFIRPCMLTACTSRQARWIGLLSEMPEPPVAR